MYQTPYLQLGTALIVVGTPIVGSRPPIVKASLLLSFFGSNFSRFFVSIALVSTSNFDSTLPLYKTPNSAAISLISLVCYCTSLVYFSRTFFSRRSFSRFEIRSCCSLLMMFAERLLSMSCNCRSFCF